MHSTLIRLLSSLKKKDGRALLSTSTARIRLVSINDVYELKNLPKLQTFLSSLSSSSNDYDNQKKDGTDHHDGTPDAVILPGNFLKSSQLTSLDQGRGVVSLLKTSGITHVCLGVHEGKFDLSTLKDRVQDLKPSITLINSNVRSTDDDLIQENEYTKIHTLRENWNDILQMTPSYATIQDKSKRINIALLGLLSDETTLFNNHLFRNCIPIDNPIKVFEQTYNELLMTDNNKVDFIIPITHQPREKDRELAHSMLQTSYDTGGGIIIGGRGHYNNNCEDDDNNMNNILEEVYDDNQTSSSSTNRNKIRIINTDNHAKQAACIDLDFELVEDGTANLKNVTTQFIELESNFEDSFVVKSILNQKLQVVKNLENEVIVDYHNNNNIYTSSKEDGDDDDSSIPKKITTTTIAQLLSSESSQSEPTTFGTMVCNAIKEEMLTDAAIVNGGAFYGNKTYYSNTMTFGELQRELVVGPTTTTSATDVDDLSSSSSAAATTTIVVVQMTRLELYKAITYARMNRISEPNGFLQTDSDLSSLVESNDDDYDEDEIIQVAVPHHLLIPLLSSSSSDDNDDGRNCNILPLIQIGKTLQQQKTLPALDDGTPILDLVTRNCCKDRWIQILDNTTTTTTSLSSLLSFDGIDLNQDGVLDKDEITILLTKVFGYKPQEYVIDDMIKSIDIDGNGVIDEDEFNIVLARLERQHKKERKSTN